MIAKKIKKQNNLFFLFFGIVAFILLFKLPFLFKKIYLGYIT
jgi:hypothetical protein